MSYECLKPCSASWEFRNTIFSSLPGLFQHFQCLHYCTRWTLYTGVPAIQNCVPNFENISLSCLARTLDNFLQKAVKFSGVLSVFDSTCMAAIFLHICDWAGVWVSPIHLFLLTNFQRYFELVIFLLIAAEEPLPPLIEPCFNSLLTRYFTSYLPYMSRS